MDANILKQKPVEKKLKKDMSYNLSISVLKLKNVELLIRMLNLIWIKMISQTNQE